SAAADGYTRPSPNVVTHDTVTIAGGSTIATAVRKRVKRVMWDRVGPLRHRESLERAIAEFDQNSRAHQRTGPRNFVTLAKLVAAAALWREESRGGHFRCDHPEPAPQWRVHSIQRLGEPISSAKQIDFGG